MVVWSRLRIERRWRNHAQFALAGCPTNKRTLRSREAEHCGNFAGGAPNPERSHTLAPPLNERQRTRLSNNHARKARCAALSTTHQRRYTSLQPCGIGPLLCHDQGQLVVRASRSPASLRLARLRAHLDMDQPLGSCAPVHLVQPSAV